MPAMGVVVSVSYAKKCVEWAGNCKMENKDKKRSDMIKTYTIA